MFNKKLRRAAILDDRRARLGAAESHDRFGLRLCGSLLPEERWILGLALRAAEILWAVDGRASGYAPIGCDRGIESLAAVTTLVGRPSLRLLGTVRSQLHLVLDGVPLDRRSNL